MKEFKKKLQEEIAEFRVAGHKFLDKEISAAEFKGISGGMGVYAQKGGEKFMIRLRIPSGVLSYKYLKLVTGFAKQYGLKTIHLTTRQAIQLHDLEIDELCDIMYAATEEGLYSRGSGGNFPRNVALSPLSGVEKGEAFDVTAYALAVSDYLQDRITEYHLPRKLKIAFSNSEKDTSNSTVNDLGFLGVRENGKPYFKLYIAGGLGNNPAIAIPYEELVPPEDVLYHVEAVTRLFVAEGDFQNKGKARLRYIPRRMGVDVFLAGYKDYLKKVKDELNLESELKLESKSSLGSESKLNSEVNLVSHLNVMPQSNLVEDNFNHLKKEEDKDNDKDNLCLIAQKQNDLYTVELHPLCGQMPTETLEKLIEFIEKYNPCEASNSLSNGEVKEPKEEIETRLTMTESMYIRNLKLSQAEELLELTRDLKKTAKIQMSISCIGVPTCQIGIEESQDLLKAILAALEESQVEQKYLPVVHISGCLNSCSRHQVNVMGFAGCKKRSEDGPVDAFELHVGGMVSKNSTRFGKLLGALKKEDIPNFMVELGKILTQEDMEFAEYIENRGSDFERLVQPYLL